MLAVRDFPPEWKLWECVLMMKPGEDPREFGRRRDIWLMPHSLKVAARMLMFEYEEVACRYVPWYAAAGRVQRAARRDARQSRPYIDQFHRALSGGLGEPARLAVSERVAATALRIDVVPRRA